jgi:glutamate synthase (NADPH/NADH) large chain
MVALGCKYLRICHLNNCATGVATQDEKLRKNHYHGLPFKVTNYFEFIARETRELMAQLGVKRLVDLIGRTDLLKELEGFTAKQQKLELSKLLETAEPHPGKALYCTENNPPFDNGVLNAQLLQQAKPFVDERRAKRSGLISATPTVPLAHRCLAISRRRMATRGWQPIRLPRTSAVPQARASACGTPAAWSCI